MVKGGTFEKQKQRTKYVPHDKLHKLGKKLKTVCKVLEPLKQQAIFSAKEI